MIKKLFKKGFLLPLILILLLGIFPKSSAYNNQVEIMRIGLYYGSGALKSANLAIRTGDGYEFGWFNESRQFMPLASTTESQLTMLKDKNMYLTWSGTYTDVKPSNYAGAIGCYHILLEKRPNDYGEARALADQFSGGFVGYYNGAWRVCVGSFESAADAEKERDERGFNGSAFTASSRCVTVVKTSTDRILFEYDCGDKSSLAVRTMDVTDKQTGTITEKAQSWFKGRSYYGTFQYTRLNGDDLTVVNYVPIEDYVKGVVPYESGSTWPIEALKAQAVCARTYAARNIGNHSSMGFDLCNSTCCQVYFGTDGATTVSNRAVDETKGLYVLYNGKLCDTVYHSSDGGATEDSENVFYEAVPYLRGVVDPYESGVSTGYSSWSYTYTAENITWILQAKGYNCSDIVSITPTYTKMGNIYSLKFTDSNGKSFTFSKDKAGSILYSKTLGKYTHSQRFTIVSADAQGTTLYVNGTGTPVADAGKLYAIGSGGVIEPLGNIESLSVLTAKGKENVSVLGSGVTQSGSSYVVSGSGWGHNVGMSQYGALGMAKQGFTFDEIIKFYYTGVTLG